MDKNDVLRRVRYILDLSDSQVVDVFKKANLTVTREQISQWLKKDDDPDYIKIKDLELAVFLNGLINQKRGKREGEQPKPEKSLTNNLILRKLSIAFNLKSDEILEAIALTDFELSKHELSAFFRKPEHKNYRECKAQILRKFLTGLQLKYRES